MCHSDLEVLFVFRQKGNNMLRGRGAHVEENILVCFVLTGQSPVSKFYSSSQNWAVDQKYSSGIEEFTAGMFLEEGKVIFLYIGNVGEFLHVIILISTAKVQLHD